MAGNLQHFKVLKEFLSKEDPHYRSYKSKLWAQLQPLTQALSHFSVVYWLSHNLPSAFPCLVPHHDSLSTWNVFSPPLHFPILLPCLKTTSSHCQRTFLMISVCSFIINSQHLFSKMWLELITRYFLRRSYTADLHHCSFFLYLNLLCSFLDSDLREGLGPCVIKSFA